MNFGSFGASKMETVGGLKWGWTSLLKGYFIARYGMWFSARIISGNLAQLIIAMLLLLGGLALTFKTAEDYEPIEDHVQEFIAPIIDFLRVLPTVDAIISTVSRFFSNFMLRHVNIGDCPTIVDDLKWCTAQNITDCLTNRRDYLCALQSLSNQTIIDTQLSLADKVELQERILNATGFAADAFRAATEDHVQYFFHNSVHFLHPEQRYMVVVPLLVATVLAFLTALAIAGTMLPSAAATILKLRTGIIPFMDDPQQMALRCSPDQVVYLQGSIFWGTLLSSILMGAFFGTWVFIFLWQATRVIAQRLMVIFLGSLVVICINCFLEEISRCATSKAFYRHRVFLSNAILIGRECAYFATAVGFSIVRVLKLLLTTILYVGRLDRTLLATGVAEVQTSLFNFRLDSAPYFFLIDILQHEAQ